MIGLLLQLVGITHSGASEEMNQGAKMRERETIAVLERGDARVSEVNGELTVYGTRTDQLVAHAARLERMTSLHASWMRDEPELSGPELQYLRGHQNLREIDIHGMPISGEYFEVLATLPKLEILRCEPTGNVKEALRQIGKCKCMRELILDRTEIADEDLESLRGLERLEKLRLSDTPASFGIRVVGHMKKLKDLGLEDTQVDDDTLRVLKNLPDLEKLFIGSPNVTDVGVELVSQCRGVRTLAIESEKVTADGVRRLHALSQLTYLDLRVTLSDLTICEAVGPMKNLMNLVCIGAGISEETRQKVQQSLPKCGRISWIEPIKKTKIE